MSGFELESIFSKYEGLRQSDSLFVTLNKPHKAASVSTIAGWIQNVIKQSDQHGMAGSTRSVSTSHALSRGVTLEKILKAGDWARVSTFKRFYYKAVPVTLQTATLTNK